MAKEEQQNVEIVKKFYNYFKSRDMLSAFALFENNATLHGPAAAGVLPWGGAHHGKDGAAQFFKALSESLEPQQFELHDFIAQGKKVVALGYQKGLAKPTGKPFEIQFVHVWTVQDGRFAEFRVYNDTAALVEALRK